MYSYMIYDIFVHISIIYLKTSIRISSDDLYTAKYGVYVVLDIMYKMCTTELRLIHTYTNTILYDFISGNL